VPALSTSLPSKLAALLARLRERGHVRRAGSEWRTRCPAHDDNGPSLYVGQSLDNSHVLLRCNAGCDVEDIVNALDLDMDVLFVEDDRPIEVEDDFTAVDEALTGSEISPQPHTEQDVMERPDVGIEPAGPDVCHEAYSALLGSLSLCDAHRQDLRRRGLEDVDIDELGYRSLERFALNQAVGRLKSRFDEETLLRVPGFVHLSDRVRFVDVEGLLVPVRNLAGQIVALKIRRNEGNDGPKYLCASSASRGGPSPGSPLHVPLGTPSPSNVVRLTEGELKADISWKRAGMPTIGIPGVANWKTSLEPLKTLGAKVVHLAFDADATIKPGVAKELAACARKLIDEGFDVCLETWDPATKGIDDLLASGKQPKVISGQRVLAVIDHMLNGTGEHSDGADEDDWVPTSLNTPVEPFPIDCLPEPVGRFVTEAGEALNCPIDFLGLPVLVVAASAIGRSRRIRICPGFEEGPRLYGAIVGSPSSGKSPAQDKVCAPVFAQQESLQQQYRQAKAEYERELRRIETDPGSPERNGQALERPTRSILRHVYVADATTEALAAILERTPRGIIQIRDELTGLILGMNQYKRGHGSDRPFYLSCWSGEQAKVDRKTDQGESMIISDPFLCVIGCVTPAMLGALDDGHDGEDGFIHRFLFVFPQCLRERHWNWDGLSEETSQVWSVAVQRLQALDMVRDAQGTPGPRVIDLAFEARPCWECWYNRHAAEMASEDFPENLIGPWSKLVGYAARLALVVHLLRYTHQECTCEQVDAECLARAFRLIDYFKSQARAVYARLHVTQEQTRVQRAIAWIRRHGGRCIPTDLARCNVAGIQRQSEAEVIMRELADRGFGHCEKVTARNKREVLHFIAKPLESAQIGSSRVGVPDLPIVSSVNPPTG